MKKILFIFTLIFLALGASAQYSGKGPVSLTAPSGATNIQWFKDGVAVPGQVGTTYVASLAGSYYASYTDATTSCTNDRTLGFVLLNSGENVVLNGTTNNSSGTAYQWYNGTTSISGANNPNYTATTGGLYQLKFNNGICEISTVQNYVFVLDPTLIANPDNITLVAGIPTNIPVLTNDKNPDGSAADLTKVTLPTVPTSGVGAPTKGTVTINPDGTIRYTPNANATGTDSFTYTICDKANPTVCSTATVSVDIICSKPVLTVQNITCTGTGSGYTVTFSSNATVTTNNGTVSGNTVTVSSGNATLTSTTSCGEVTSLAITAPSCPVPATCTQVPSLSVGNALCTGTGTYTVSFSATNGTVTSSAGTVSGNTVTNIPVGVNAVLTITPTSTACNGQSITVTSPVSCAAPSCTDGSLGISYSTACNSSGTYTINYTTSIAGTTVTSSANSFANLTGTVTLTVMKPGCSPQSVVVSAPACVACPKPVLTIQNITCSGTGSGYTVTFSSNATVTTNNGTVSGNTVTVSSGNATLTSTSSCGEVTSLAITAPSCPVPATCTQVPSLSVGNALCTGTGTYTVSFSATNGTVTSSAGTVSGNTVTNIPVGTNAVLTITPTSTACNGQSITVTSPVSCAAPSCTDGSLGISYSTACNSSGTYTINYTTSIAGTTVTSSANSFANLTGTVTLTVTKPGCSPQSVVVSAPACVAFIPKAVNDMLTAPQGVTSTVNVLTNDDFLPGAGTSLTVISGGTATGTATFNPLTGMLSYVPAPGETGLVTLRYRVCNTVPNPDVCAEATVSITISASNAKLNLKVLLQGALLPTSSSGGPIMTGIMRDDLRTASPSQIPNLEPYTGLANSRFTHVGGGGETMGAGVLSAAGNDAIVDWVFVELRDKNNPATILKTRSALVQRDGDVVESTDGISPLTFTGAVGESYYVSVKHRNHLGAMTAGAIAMTATGTLVDFTTMTAAQTYHLPGYDGFEQVDVNGKMALWAGNTNADKKVKYVGVGNDQIPVFGQAVNYVTNTTQQYNFDFATPVYLSGDINMDAKVKYRGPNNDTSFIFFNVITKYALMNTGALYNYDLFIEQLP